MAAWDGHRIEGEEGKGGWSMCSSGKTFKGKVHWTVKRRAFERKVHSLGVCVLGRVSRRVSGGRCCLSSQEEDLFPWEEQGLDVGSRLAFDQGSVCVCLPHAQP